MSDLVTGSGYLLRGLDLALRPGIRRYAVLPVLITAALFAAAVWLLATRFSAVVGWLMARVPDWLDWLSWPLWLVFAFAVVAAVLFGFVLVVGVVAAPFNGMLAEAVERLLTGQEPPSRPWHHELARLPRTVVQELAKAVYALALAVPFLLLFLVPAVNVVAPVSWFLFCAWITAFGFVDYPMSNHGHELAAMRRTLRARLPLALGFGAAAFLALTVPVLNLLALPAAVCGATAMWVERLRVPATSPAGPESLPRA